MTLIRFFSLTFLLLLASLAFAGTDGDGVPDEIDAFPNDPSASVDSDNDGYPDAWNPGQSRPDSNSDLFQDFYPNDSSRYHASMADALAGLADAGLSGVLRNLISYRRGYLWCHQSQLPRRGRLFALGNREFRQSSRSDSLRQLY